MESEQSRPSKFVDYECGLRSQWKHQQKLINARGLKLDRMGRCTRKLLKLEEKYKQ